LDNTVRTLSRGSFVGPFLDEITAGTQKALQVATGGAAGSDYDEALEYQRARDRAIDRDYPVASTFGKLTGGFAGGIGALRQGGVTVGGVLTGGPLATVAPAATTWGNVKQGAVIGPTYGAIAGFGEGDGVDDRMSQAGTGAKYGLAAGVALPPAIAAAGRIGTSVADTLSPVAARYGTNVNNLLAAYGIRSAERPPMSVGAAAADGASGIPPITGAEAAADQILANHLARENINVADLRQRFAQIGDDARYGSNSFAQDVMAPVDVASSWQRLAGSLARQNPEAATIGQRFLFGRQTGTTPRGVDAGDMADTGIATRAAMARPITGSEAERQLGRRFGTPKDKLVPMGQYERIRDAFKRALRIRDEDFHGHARNAYRTDEQIIAAAKSEAQTFYNASYKAAEGIDYTPAVVPFVQRWRSALIDEPQDVARRIDSALKQVERAVSPSGTKSHLERLDKVKQVMDDQIDNAFTSTNGRQRYLGGKLTEVKNELLSVLDNVQGGQQAGAKYKTARDAFSSRMDAREALRLGREAMREDSDISVDAFKPLSAGLQKLFRLGMLDDFEKRGAIPSRTRDLTTMFDSPRVQEILAEVIPRSDKVGAEFANRPERFGRYLGDQRSMVETRNVAYGGSQTQKNSQDDKATDMLSSMFEEVKQTPSAVAFTLKVVERGLDKLLGFRADTAQIMARKLFTADRAERDRLLLALEQRLGPSRVAQFARLMQEHQARVSRAGVTAGMSAPGAPEGN